MVGGAIIAAMYDLQLDLLGVAFVCVNNVLTSLTGVLMEKKMDAKDINSWGLMFYNSMFAIPVLLGYMVVEGNEVCVLCARCVCVCARVLCVCGRVH